MAKSSSNNTIEDFIYGHHQMINTEIRLMYFFQAKMEKLYTVSKTKIKIDYGSDHGLLIAIFKLKLKKAR